jgi:hypothetical protein
MKPSRFTEEQIIGILREQEAGAALISEREAAYRSLKDRFQSKAMQLAPAARRTTERLRARSSPAMHRRPTFKRRQMVEIRAIA